MSNLAQSLNCELTGGTNLKEEGKVRSSQHHQVGAFPLRDSALLEKKWRSWWRMESRTYRSTTGYRSTAIASALGNLSSEREQRTRREGGREGVGKVSSSSTPPSFLPPSPYLSLALLLPISIMPSALLHLLRALISQLTCSQSQSATTLVCQLRCLARPTQTRSADVR